MDDITFAKVRHARLDAYNKKRSCTVCKEKIGTRPYVEPYLNIQHEKCWNNTFERNLI